MMTNPNKEWTPLERLQVINELAVNAINKNLLKHPAIAFDIMDVIAKVCSKEAEFLEKNREKIVALA